MSKYKKYINSPKIRKASELPFHEDGQGTRYLFLDNSIVPESNLYTIVRTVNEVTEDKQSHVEIHKHNCNSTFIFLGNKPNLEGLICGVTLGDEKHIVSSPASVFIPKGLEHSYRFIRGSGKYINIVLSGNYNKSLL